MIGSITANRKRKRLERSLKLIGVLQDHHPLAFPPKDGHPVQPLASNIADEVSRFLVSIDPLVTRHEVDRLLEYWESRKFYLKAFEYAEHKINLLGEPTEPLADTEREKALSRKLSIVAQRQLSE